MDIQVTEKTKTIHVYEHDQDVLKAEVGCGCMEIININSGNVVFSYKAPRIEDATKKYPLYEGYMNSTRTIRITDKTGKKTVTINVRINESK